MKILDFFADCLVEGESVEFPRLCMELCGLLSKNFSFSYPSNVMKLSCQLLF